MTTRPTRLAIVNPHAGQGRCGLMAKEAIAKLRERGFEFDVWYTRHAGHATEFTQQAYESGYRDFVAIGGDGTSHEIINGLGTALGAQGDARVSLSFLPLGTGNSFLRDFGSSDWQGMIPKLVANEKRPCDVVKVRHDSGDIYFFNVFSFGYVADACLIANTRYKKLGPAGYAVAALQRFPSLKPVKTVMMLDDAPRWEQPALVVFVNNSQYTGGHMHVSPYADPTDGFADVTLLGPVSKPTFLRLFAKMFSGTHVHHPAVTTSRARRIAFEFADALDVMIDGEVVNVRPLELEVLSAALDVIV